MWSPWDAAVAIATKSNAAVSGLRRIILFVLPLFPARSGGSRA